MSQKSLSSLFAFWTRIGCLSFGGPAGQIALMHRELVERHRLLPETEFLRALNFCMFLPGPEAQQLATWVGWRQHGWVGGLIAGLMFIIPGALLVAVLTWLYLSYGRMPVVTALFDGVQATVLAIVVQAVARVSKRALRDKIAIALAVFAFVALFFFTIPFPFVMLAAAAFGWFRRHAAPASRNAVAASWLASLRIMSLWLVIWLAPIALAALILGWDHQLTQIGTFFARMATVTFGGAYAALSYVAQAAVSTHGWLSAHEMLDGLGLAETTPGPLILVFEFVGGLAGSRMAGWPQGLGVALGMAMALWATFAPSFLWIFTFAPHLERLSALPRLDGALAGITAAVVGVMGNLALWFALHLLFQTVRPEQYGWLRLWVPEGSFDLYAAAIGLIAWGLLTRTRAGLAGSLAYGATAGLVRYALTALPI